MKYIITTKDETITACNHLHIAEGLAFKHASSLLQPIHIIYMGSEPMTLGDTDVYYGDTVDTIEPPYWTRLGDGEM